MYPSTLEILKHEMTEDRLSEISCIPTEHDMAVVGAGCYLFLYRPDHEDNKDNWELLVAHIDTGASRTMMSAGMAEATRLSRIGPRTITLAVGTAECVEYGPCCVRIADFRRRIYSRPVSLAKVTATNDHPQQYAGALLGRDALRHFDLEYLGLQGRALLRQSGGHS